MHSIVGLVEGKSTHSVASEPPFITQYFISTCHKPIGVESVLHPTIDLVLNRHLFEQDGPQSSELQVQRREPAPPLWRNHLAVSDSLHFCRPDTKGSSNRAFDDL
ncbi:hypothetical protein PoMZ_10658 [Pyricularia oryzae]|uniref:Uncharacterized protein n=1 Tax=Pyricularia oryzae TaxID=318829 RepID=A0A4V1C529_PYROR|nr:hypothetical protein PoMZ_10658 [Pyricularia oryzae]